MVFNYLFIIDRQEFKQFSLDFRSNDRWIKNVEFHINDIFIIIHNWDDGAICKVKSLKDSCEFYIRKLLLKKYSKVFFDITYETGRLRLH